MFKLWTVNLDQLQKSDAFKSLSTEEQQRALTIASEISLEVTPEAITPKFGKRSAKGSYEVKHTSDSGWQVETKLDSKVDTIILNLTQEGGLHLKSKNGELWFK